MQAHAQITAAFVQNASKAIGDYAQAKLNEANILRAQAMHAPDEAAYNALIRQAEELEMNWGEGGIYRVVLHSVVGGLAGNVEGALGAGASALSAPFITEATKHLPDGLKEVAGAIIASSIGAATGGASGAAAALNEDVNNRMQHLADFEKKLTRCQKDSSGPGCATILKMVEGITEVPQESLSTGYEVVAHIKDDVVQSYLVSDTLAQV